VASYPDAPQDNGRQQQQQGHAAHQPQLLAADGENQVALPHGEGIAVGGVGLDTLPVALAEQLARADGQGGPCLLPAGIQGVEAVVEYHPEAHNAEVGPHAGFRQEEQPENHCRQDGPAAHQDEPPQLDPGGPGHEGEDHDIHRAGAHVVTDGGDQSQHEHGEAGNLHHRGDGTYAVPPVLDFDDLEGQDQNKGDLYDLVGLEHHGEAGELEPVPVAVAGNPKWGEQQKQEQDAADQKQLPPFFGEQLEIHKGEQYVGHHSQADGDGLDEHRPVDELVWLVLVLGGGVDEGQAEGAGGQAQPQQDFVACFPKLLDGRKQRGQKGHSITSDLGGGFAAENIFHILSHFSGNANPKCAIIFKKLKIFCERRDGGAVCHQQRGGDGDPGGPSGGAANAGNGGCLHRRSGGGKDRLYPGPGPGPGDHGPGDQSHLHHRQRVRGGTPAPVPF